jgi:hypothetical protein
VHGNIGVQDSASACFGLFQLPNLARHTEVNDRFNAKALQTPDRDRIRLRAAKQLLAYLSKIQNPMLRRHTSVSAMTNRAGLQAYQKYQP